MSKMMRFLEGKKHIIWDWNGTLVDDIDHCILTLNSILTDFGLPGIDHTGYQAKFGFPVRNFYLEMGFPDDRQVFSSISHTFITRYDEALGGLNLHASTSALLRALHGAGFGHSVLSATEERKLHQQIAGQGLSEFFANAFGLGDYEANGKLERGRDLILALGCERHELLLIGDTDHDLHVAQSLEIDVLLYAGGHQGEKRLKAVHEQVLSSAEMEALAAAVNDAAALRSGK